MLRFMRNRCFVKGTVNHAFCETYVIQHSCKLSEVTCQRGLPSEGWTCMQAQWWTVQHISIYSKHAGACMDVRAKISRNLLLTWLYTRMHEVAHRDHVLHCMGSLPRGLAMHWHWRGKLYQALGLLPYTEWSASRGPMSMMLQITLHSCHGFVQCRNPCSIIYIYISIKCTEQSLNHCQQAANQAK